MSTISEITNSKAFINCKNRIKNSKKEGVKTQIVAPLSEDVQYAAIFSDFEEYEDYYLLAFVFIDKDREIVKNFRVYKNSYNAFDILYSLVHKDDANYEDAVGRAYLVSFKKKVTSDDRTFENIQIFHEIVIEEKKPKKKVTKDIETLIEGADDKVEFPEEDEVADE